MTFRAKLNNLDARARSAQIRRRFAGTVLLVFAATVALGAASGPGMPSSRAVSLADSPLDSIFADYNKPDVPGASVVVIKNGKIIAQRLYGLTDLEKKTRTSASSNYRLASLSKQFTAMAVMVLSENGKLGLDDKIVNFLPPLPHWAKDITIRQLLSHTSGVWAYENFVPDSQTTQVKDRDVPTLLQRAESTYFAPGSAFRYSNSGYALLALIVEHASGMGYAKYLKDNVFKTAGMTRTVAFENGVSTVPDRAWGYTKRGDSFERTDQSNTSAVLGDGGIYSSVSDLTWWVRSLNDHVLVHPETQQTAWTPVLLNSGTPTEYGFGWFIKTDGGETHYWHNGETRGFTNGIAMYPKRKVTVIVLTNRSGGEPWKLAERVAALKAFK